MEVRINYQECLTNVSNSIRKYFGLEVYHDTIPYIDDLLESKQPKNVIFMLFDGMGTKILERHVTEDSFFMKHKVKDITSVFPATTTAATTTARTGLNPSETCFLGWNTYLSELDKIITLFRFCEKGSSELSQEYLKLKQTFEAKKIAEELNESTPHHGLELMPVEIFTYQGMDEMFELIHEDVKKEGKRFIYAYDTEPDSSMHRLGVGDSKIKEIILDRQARVEKMCEELEDSVVIVVADHGLIDVDNVYLEDYPHLVEMLERAPSIEQRAISFKIKEGYKEVFKKEFNASLGEYFTLYDKEDVLSSQLFGDGKINDMFEDAIGDFVAIAQDNNKCLLGKGDMAFKAQHAGYTEDELMIPLIVIDKSGKSKNNL